MTREEAIKTIENRDSIMDYCESAELGEALDMAIEALSAEPCEDAISRQAVIDGIDAYIEKTQSTGVIDGFISFEELVVKALPSVTPKQKMGRWIREERHHTGQDQEFDYVVHFCSECGAQKRIGWMGVKYCPECGTKMSENPTGSSCTDCVLDGTDACSRGAGRAVDGRVCEDFVGESGD